MTRSICSKIGWRRQRINFRLVPTTMPTNSAQNFPTLRHSYNGFQMPTGPKGLKRPAVGLAVMFAKIATDEIAE